MLFYLKTDLDEYQGQNMTKKMWNLSGNLEIPGHPGICRDQMMDDSFDLEEDVGD